MNDDIEILDINSNNKEREKKVVVNMNNNNSKKKKKKLKTKGIQIIFCSISFIFILGCIIYYGSRFIKYYRIYNPKIEQGDGSVLLASTITGNSEIVYEGDGLYISSGNYIYKGNVSNNYVLFNNMLWRIIRINKDNTLEIILDDYINILPWNKDITSFSKSEIYNYLEDKILNNLNKDLLVKTDYCADEINDLNSITCNNRETDSYIKLLDISNFLNSVKNKKSYLVSDDEIFWLSNYSTDKVWHTNGVNISSSDSTSFYEVRPIVKLSSTVYYSKGDGTKDNPYNVDSKNNLSLGSRVQLGNDNYIVYDISDNIYLMSENVLEDKHIFDKKSLTVSDSEGSLFEYLNNEYLDKLSYKEKLVSTKWYIGGYSNSLTDIKSDTITSKVMIPSMLDSKINSSVNGYFTSTNNGEMLLVYENPLRVSRSTSERNVRVCIALSKDYLNKLKYDNGIFKEA